MDDPQISDMMEMQRALWELHKDFWPPMEPKHGRDYNREYSKKYED